ncbi:hypothetical protein K9N50_00865 [bacterium]|nr:hypothetical protein [bacterium]
MLTIKNTLLVLLLLTLTFSTVDARIIEEFTATSQDRAAELEWTTGSERGVSEYRLQRSFDGRTFYTIHEVTPGSGVNHTYQYVDDDLFKNQVRTFYYRVEVSLNSGNFEYSQTENVTFSFSGIIRTWGSIKAMFR